uniref:Uncharacterized protein n=1 Tax=Romanomermis culicivorax TaxID=13658 RepID=A0A915I1B7_ROMCU
MLNGYCDTCMQFLAQKTNNDLDGVETGDGFGEKIFAPQIGEQFAAGYVDQKYVTSGMYKYDTYDSEEANQENPSTCSKFLQSGLTTECFKLLLKDLRTRRLERRRRICCIHDRNCTLPQICILASLDRQIVRSPGGWSRVTIFPLLLIIHGNSFYIYDVFLIADAFVAVFVEKRRIFFGSGRFDLSRR